METNICNKDGITMNIVSNLLTVILGSTFLVSCSVLSIGSSNQEYTCNGTVSGTLVYGDGEVTRVDFNGRDPVSSTIIAQFRFSNLSNLATLTDQERYAGENGITVEDDGHNILLFPGGYSGQQVVHLFNYTSESTSAINVYCQPVSLAYRPDQRLVVGHCTINTTIMRVPYFGLGVRNGKWMDISPTGLYSNQLDTINLTNAIILQYKNDYDAFATMLYFADSSTLHEIDLGNLGVDTYPLPNRNQIYRLVPAGNSPFPVLRVIFYNGNNSGYSHHYFSSSESRFMNLIFHTDFVAYDSFDLSYLVTFVNHNTLTIIRRDKTSKQFPLNITLDDPIQCENMIIGPNVHYLICLADGGLHPVIINIIEPVTSEVIPVFNSQIVQIRMLTKETFYLLTAEREMLFYVVNSAVIYLGRYALRRGIGYVITSTTSDIICSNATGKPNNINTARNGLQLAVIIAMIVFGIVIALLLLIPVPLAAAIRSVKNKYMESPNSEELPLPDDNEQLPLPDNKEPPLPDNEQLPLPDNEQLPLPDNEQLPLPDNEEPPLPDNEQLPLPDNEQLPLPDDEQLPLPDNEEPPLPDNEQLPLPDNEQLPLPDNEQLPLPDNERLPLPDNEQLPLPNGEQSDHDDDGNTSTSLVERDDSQPTCNSSVVTGPVSFGGGQNNERIVFTSEEQETVPKSHMVIQTVNRNLYVMPSGAPRESCDTKNRNFEQDSSQPEQFIEAKSETNAVQCTNKDPSKPIKPIPPPAIVRDFLKQ